jgi:two-component system cell cycle sensor histidine kinase/response regulator CckA
MVVEDEGLIALDLRRHLENFGYVVPVVTKTADDAVRFQAEHLPDLILMDIHLKGEKDGIDAAAEIRKNSDVPIIFVTAHADPATIERAKMTEAAGYIVKPFVSINIRAQIEVALHKHQFERKLRQSEALYSTTLQNIGEAVITTGIDGKVEFMNPAAERLTGWLQGEVKGVSLEKPLVLERSGTPLAGNLIRCATLNDELLSLGPSLVLIARDGRRRDIEAEISAAAPDSGQSAMAVITFRDITQRKWKERQDCQKHAIRAVERLAETTTNVLNNLLKSLSQGGDLPPAPEQLAAEHVQNVSKVQSAAQKIAEVIRQLAAISRPRLATGREVNVNDLIQRSLPTISKSLAQAIAIRTELDPGVCSILGDWGQLEQVLFALVSNARDAIPGRGEIVISTRSSFIETSGSLEERKMVTVTVRDNGEGMSKETCERIFEPFFTTKKDSVAHPGVGLCITDGIIRDYHGFLDVKSVQGIGTEVTFAIPTIEGDPFGYLDESADTPSSMNRILVVSNDHGVRRVLRSVLESSGYVVVEAQGDEDALVVAGLHDGPIDVVLTDIGVPSMSAVEFLPQFAALHPEALLLSLLDFASDRLEVPNEPAREGGIVPAPVIRRKELLRQVEVLLSKSCRQKEVVAAVAGQE